MTHVDVIVGARPQFVKAAVLMPALQALGIDARLTHTGQHYDAALTSDVASALGLVLPPPLMAQMPPSGRPLGAMYDHLVAFLTTSKPALVLVLGDTVSTLAGAIAASDLGISVAHVEGGVRCGSPQMIEERNRTVVDHLSLLHMVTSQDAALSLQREGISSHVHVVGDLLLDARKNFSQQIEHATPGIPLSDRFGLVTLHRAETVDSEERLGTLMRELNRLSEDLPLVWPMHPRTHERLKRYSIELSPAIQRVPPLGYLSFQHVLSRASVCLTDSGGAQREAYYAQTPCVVLRDASEWTEIINTGWGVLAGVNPIALRSLVQRAETTKPSAHPPLFGTGDAASRIARIVQAWLPQH